ncbi:MAG TPA: DUF4232 domain-containing protein [Acidimicrobiales bacterium]
MRRQTLLHRGSLFSKVAGWSGALTLVAALGVWGLPSGPVASAAATPACTTSNLVVWLNTTGSGAAGSSYYRVNFTNLSAHSCTLYGYPGISSVSQSGIQLGLAAGRDAAHVASTITLTSARSASGLEKSTSHNTATAILQITVAENFPISACAAITAAGLRVYPPGQKESSVIPFPFVACAKSGPRFLHVEAVQRYVATQ